MATGGMKKKTSSASNDETNDHSFLNEERRLLKASMTTNQRSKKSTQKYNTRVNQMTSDEMNEELTRQQLSTRGDSEIRRARLKHGHRAKPVVRKNSTNDVEEIFDYIAVVDFEATCEQNRANYQNEIIEFPIVLINVQEQTIIEKFQSYCRPVRNPILSQFCTELTGIEQHQVDAAPIFPEVLQNVETWLNERNLLTLHNRHRLAFATDGPWDFRNFLQLQCQLSSIPYPQWAEQWINIRKEFARFYGVRACGLQKMLGKLGLSFDGRPHSGLDDATNIARIVVELLKDGCVLSFNDGISKLDPKSAEEKTESSKDGEEDDIIFQN